MGATNTPWELDEAFRRRFEKRIYISLPEKNARSFMFKGHIDSVPNTLEDGDYDKLAENSTMYSGADIKIVAKEANYMPIRTCQNATKFKQDADGMYCPVDPSDPGG